MKKFIQFERTNGRAVLRRLMPVTATVTLGLLLLSGCASTPQPPTQALQAAEMAITTAEQARVADYAAPELGEARQKLAAANAAVQAKNMTQAQRLAEQARVDAELAVARNDVGKAKIVNDEMKKSTDTIKTEMQRNPGVQP
jgi:PBP1b-binding outer membrane lipoprotein LpoB